jgi:aminopeptidase N
MIFTAGRAGLSIFFFLLCCGLPAQATITVLHQDLHIILVPGEQRLEGNARLTVQRESAGDFELYLAEQAQVLEVTVDERPAKYRFAGGRLSVRLAGKGPSLVQIQYRARFADAVPEDPVHAEDPGYGVAATIGQQGVFLGGGVPWYPQPAGVIPSMRLRVEAPAGTEAVTAGRRTERCTVDGRNYSVWSIEHPLRSLSLAAGPYTVGEMDVAGIPVYTYFYAESAELAATYQRAAAGYLQLYQQLFGPYPFAKFAVVENFFPTGYGFPSWTLLGSTVVRLPFIVETSLGHEIAHSWWGNGVWVDYRRGNWSEGLTTYVAEHLYKERESAEAAREHRLKILRDYAALVTPERDFPLRTFTSRTTAAGQAIGYGKATMVFHMLRQTVGEEVFWGGLREIATSRLFQETSWDDFAATYSRKSGQDLAPFFAQWLDRPGAPQLALQEVQSRSSQTGHQVTGRLLQRRPTYSLLVPMRLRHAGGADEITVVLDEEQSAWSMASVAQPEQLQVDPEVHLFRQLDPAELPPTVNVIRGSDRLLVIAADHLPEETLTTARILLAALRQNQAPLIRERDVAVGQLSGRDLLFFGWPSRPELRPPLPAGWQLAADGFTADGQRYEQPQAALFAVFAHPQEQERAAAVLLPLSPAAATDTVRRIPHYGRYSYLVFVDGDNRAKETWPITISPTQHNFQEVPR